MALTGETDWDQAMSLSSDTFVGNSLQSNFDKTLESLKNFYNASATPACITNNDTCYKQ
jgi:hypothetical protein